SGPRRCDDPQPDASRRYLWAATRARPPPRPTSHSRPPPRGQPQPPQGHLHPPRGHLRLPPRGMPWPPGTRGPPGPAPRRLLEPPGPPPAPAPATTATPGTPATVRPT